jgi:dihydrofolate synthase/folylpolyglutamate synthase
VLIVEYGQALRQLEKLSMSGSTLGLSRSKELERRLDAPSSKYRCILVAGSNGKGSVATMIARGLEESGERTGLYLSPHVDTPRERISVGGKMISEKELAAEYGRVAAAANKMKDRPSFFELFTAMALDYFAVQKVEWAVLEVGMGGRLDATNVVEPELSVVTRVDLEHVQKLGSTLAQIAHEKAGVMRQARVCVTGAKGGALAALMKEGEARGAQVVAVHGKYAGKLALLGEHQKRNAAVAEEALRRLGVNGSAIAKGLARADIAGRLEAVGKKPLVLQDAAHNPAAARELAAAVRGMRLRQPLVLVFGAMRDKDYDGVLAALAPLARAVVVNRPKVERAEEAEKIAEAARKYNKNVRVVEDVRKSVAVGKKLAGKGGTVLVTGSIYMLSEARGKNELQIDG